MSKLDGNIAGVILAAGEGKRIGGNKALLRLRGLSFLELIANPMMICGCDPVIVVLGSQDRTIRDTFKNLNVDFITNENWHTGQFSSLRAGLAALPPNISGAMISLVDHPLTKKSTYQLLFDVFAEHLNKIILPIYEGRRGHPIIIPRQIIEEIQMASDDQNLREIIRLHSDLIIEQLADDPGILQDIDTDADLKGIKKS